MVMAVPTIAIIGMGSRGLSILEQLIGMSRHATQQPLHIEVFDPQPPGSGLHHAQQADYLMLNTMAGQLSAFSSAFPACEPAGWTFLQWCGAHDVRLDERGHVCAEGQGRPVGFGDFVPRRLLGRYLQDSYRFVLQQCPAHVRVRHYAERVDACRALPDASGFRLRGQQRQMQVDAVFLTSGHAADSAEQQPSGETVAIEGLGLTAMDTLASLTQGRGGRYVRDGGFAGWRYLPSGREPKVFLYSRSGLPFHARPQWHSPNEAPLPRLFLGAEVIAGLRQQRPAGQLDFRRDVLPLIKDEMRAVFYQARVRLVAPRQLPSVQRLLREATSRPALFALLADQWGEFEPDEWLVTERWSGLAESYATWFVEWIERDLALSRLGTARSPIRLALEVWRDYRDVLRLVAGRNGLSEASTLDFYGTWAGLSNRLVGGPQKERHEDLLALIKAGVVAVLPPMDEARQFDCVIPARVAHNGLSRPAQGLIGDLLEQGLIRAAHAWPADGIETDRTGRALGRDGSPQPRLWVLGPVVEGCTFYNHYIPTPDPTCHALIEARRAVESCLAMLAEPDSRYLTCSFKKVL
ncbi:FAD/NAD(P)-binding protein [Pseudomonas cannabina]